MHGKNYTDECVRCNLVQAFKCSLSVYKSKKYINVKTRKLYMLDFLCEISNVAIKPVVWSWLLPHTVTTQLSLFDSIPSPKLYTKKMYSTIADVVILLLSFVYCYYYYYYFDSE